MKQKRKKKQSRALKGKKTRASEFKLENVRKIISRIEHIVAPLCDYYGIELIHVQCQRESNGRIIRIYIDKPGGATLDDCVVISKQLSDLLDVNLEIKGEYNLEVSSPGINRPMYKEHDFEKYKGNMAKIVTRESINGQHNFIGTLLGISQGIAMLKMNDKDVSIPFEKITKARLVPNYRDDDGER